MFEIEWKGEKQINMKGCMVGTSLGKLILKWQLYLFDCINMHELLLNYNCNVERYCI